MTTETKIPQVVADWMSSVFLGDATPLIETITYAMDEDGDPPGRNSNRLVSLYLRASPQERGLIDQVLTIVCGWTMRSLMLKNDPEPEVLQAFDATLEATGGTTF